MQGYYDISVVVGTYNPNWEKLKATLLSILEQKNISLQIIVSDDGSINPLHTEIKTFFNHIGFSDYKLVVGKRNEGTVCQFYRGICASDAKYVKLFSSGDLLYNDMVLSDWLAFTKNNNADLTFGDCVCYNRKNRRLDIIRSVHYPRNMSIYKNEVSYRDRVITYVCLSDDIYGCTIIARKSILIYYLKFLLHRVIYAEDLFIRLAVLEKRIILYYPNTVIWYEFADGGISTTGEKKWIELIGKDSLAMYEICLENWKKPDAEIRNWLLELIAYERKGYSTLYVRILKSLKHPKWLYWRIYRQLFCAYSPVDVDTDFLEYCFNDR